MNTALTTAQAIDERGAIAARAKVLDAFLKSDKAEFTAETDARSRALGDFFEAVLSTTEDKVADVVDWETVARKAGASVQLITANTERDKVTRKGSTSLRINARKDVAAAAVAA
jgi:hypothetical protein